ncbi:uncharacterized protein LOC111403679 isoform X1 [Olea europaea var. sylvestris]|uniref:uncharacterized protein LOC111403679 isoform X1 n=1 Tax=Olea europaea var. sylvestris TaxID=158386 RepID=UPI000C1D8A98|nr:uncharacterized protein LOC111403679 isoform X1 [Olea europaea var. sylvestris]
MNISLEKQRQEKGKRKASEGIETYFSPRTTPGSQPSLRSTLAGKQAIKRAHISWARWFYDACIPFNTLQSTYFQLALDAIATIGPRIKGPSYNDIRVNLLRDCKKECQLFVDTYRSQWINNGCTIMADGWTDQRHRTLINFLVYCSSGIVFIKSYDALDVAKDAQTLCNLFSEIVEWVGPRNVVHMVMIVQLTMWQQGNYCTTNMIAFFGFIVLHIV